MTRRQYRQLLHNARRRPLTPLFGGATDSRVLRTAARRVRRRELVERALAGILRREWLDVTRVDAVERDTVVLVVSDRAVREQLRRQAPSLQRQLGQRIPGVRLLRVS